MGINVIATLTADKGNIEQWVPTIKELVLKTKKEPGNLRYEAFWQEQMITVVETWESHDALEAHKNSDHFVKFLSAIEGKKISLRVNLVDVI